MGKEALSISCSLKLNRDNCCLLCAVCYLWMGNWNGMECESRERESGPTPPCNPVLLLHIRVEYTL